MNMTSNYPAEQLATFKAELEVYASMPSDFPVDVRRVMKTLIRRFEELFEEGGV